MNRKGFTLAELMVAITILGIIMGGVVMVLINSDRAKRKNDLIIEAQQQGGAALEMLVRDIKSAGYGIPMESDQPVICYATPFEIIFNANLNPFPDSLGLKQPRAYDPGVTPHCPNYSVVLPYSGGVETYRYTFDSDNSGTFTSADRSDDVFETKTFNPNDVVLLRQTYGKMDDGTNNVYPTRNLNIALVRGPSSATDTSVIPMFQYWYRGTGDTLQLVGDANGDKQLTGNERLFANPSASIISSIEQITITVTTETKTPVDGARYRRVTVSTTTNLANVPNATAKYAISGKLKDYTSGLGIPGGKVYLNTGAMQTSNASGEYSFAVEAGAFVVTPEKLFDDSASGRYYLLFNPQDSGITVASSNVTDIDFRYIEISASDMGSGAGIVFNDSTNQGIYDYGERGIAGVQVSASGYPYAATSTNLSISTTTDLNGNYSFALPAGIYTITEVDSPGYFSTTPNIMLDTIASPGDAVTVNFGDVQMATGRININVWKDINKDSIKNTGEPALSNVFCMVTNTNNGDLIASGRTDANGLFSTLVPGDSLYTIIEIDPDSMVSTCALIRTMNTNNWVRSNDFNRIDSLTVPSDTTRDVMFGDVVGYVAIPLGQTERVLSLITPDLREVKNPPGVRTNPTSPYNDNDIVLGTVNSTGSVSNLLVWYNRFTASTDAKSSLFPSAFDGSFNLTYDITALATGNLDNPSVTNDVICGLKANPGAYNISVGLTHDGGGTGVNLDRDKGLLRYSVKTYATITSVATTTVLSLATGGLTNSNEVDFVVGTKDDENLGHLEIWKNVTGDTLGNFTRDTVMYYAGGMTIGEVRSIYLADVVDSNGTRGSDLPNYFQDLIIGTKTGSFPNYTGQLIIFRRKGLNKRFAFHACYNITDGYINSVQAYQSGKTANTARDIVCGLRVNAAASDDYKGRIDLWYNNNDGTFGTSGLPTQSLSAEGEVLCLATGQLSLDNINDLAAGLKMGDYAGGARFYYCSAGRLPVAGSDPSGGDFTGEVVTVNTTVFRPVPGKTDVVVGERYEEGGTGYGRVIIYFNNN